MIPIHLIRQHRYVRQFKQLGATSAANAIKPEEYGIIKSVGFNKLIKEKVIVQTYDRNFYLNVFQADELTKTRQTIILLLLLVTTSILIILLILVDYLSGDKFLMIGKW